MSLRVVGYDNGRPIYHDDGPGYARIPGHGGTFVVGGEPGPSPYVKTNAEVRKANKKRAQAA